MEVKDANGNWVKVDWSRQIPLPSDSAPRTFVVDLTGLIPHQRLLTKNQQLLERNLRLHRHRHLTTTKHNHTNNQPTSQPLPILRSRLSSRNRQLHPIRQRHRTTTNRRRHVRNRQTRRRSLTPIQHSQPNSTRTRHDPRLLLLRIMLVQRRKRQLGLRL